LAEGYEIGVIGIINPPPFRDKFLAEKAQVRHRTPKRCAAKLYKGAEHFPPAAGCRHVSGTHDKYLKILAKKSILN
jgi:hypothetical protein